MKAKLIALMTLAGMLNSQADLLVYEPFNYAPVNDEVNGRLAGKNGGLGFGGAWVDSADAGFAFIYDSQGNPAALYSGTFGAGDPNWDGVIANLPQIGNYAGLSDWNSEPLGQSRLNAYRPLAQSAGDMAAGNGGVLWLSMGVHFANNGFFVTPTMMLTTTNSYLQERGRTLSSSGAGLGTALGNDFNNATLTKDLNPLFMAAGVQTVKTTGVDILAGSRPDLTVILKFEFGDPNDTVRVWYFGEGATMDEATFDANAIAATSSIDEFTLNTFTYAIDRKANAVDEIRIGETFTDVITLPAPGPVDIATSTLAASPSAVPADGSTTSTITVTLKDVVGIPVPGKDVTLANTAGPQAAVISPLTAVTTDANGQATFTVTSLTPGIEDFTATNTTDSQVITQTATVTFVGAAEAGLSTVTASPSFVPADGVSTSTVTVTVLGLGSAPLANKSVTLAGAAVIVPAGAVTTDANGVATFNVSSGTPGAAVFTATVTTDSVVITQTATVNFVGTTDAALSTVAASPAAVVANGSTSSTVTVSLKDANGFPVEGNTVVLTSAPGLAAISPPSAVSNASGVATFAVSSNTPGAEVFSASDTTDTVSITQTASVEFIDSSVPLAFNVSFVQFTPSLGDFEDPALLEGPAGGSGETWNQIRAVSGANLFAADGAGTAVGVTTTYSECRQRSTSGLTLLNDALTDFGKGLSRTVTLSGLVPGSLYDLWIASTVTSGDPSERANGTFSTTNATSTTGGQTIDQSVTANTTTWEQGNNYVLFENVVVDGSGQINLTAASTAGFRLPLSGFQLVPAGKARIISFEAAGNAGVIDQGAFTIAVTVPFGTNLATLAPEFTLNSGTCDQTSGAVPSPTFAAANPVTYTVTDTSTDPDTENAYVVTVTVAPAIGTLVIDLGTGTVIEGGTFGTYVAAPGFPTNLPLPALPPGSILRSIAIDASLVATDNNNFASDFALLLDPTPGTPGGDFSVEITNGTDPFGAGLDLAWPAAADGGVGTALLDTKTDADWAAAGAIDLNATGLFLGNAFLDAGFTPGDGGTWSGTITLSYDLVGGGNDFSTWVGGFGLDPLDQGFSDDPDGDNLKNGVEAFFGTDPGEFNPGLTEVSTAGAVTTFQHPEADPPLDDVTGSYEWSLDAQNWNPSGVEVGGTTVTIPEPPAPVAGITTVTATASGTIPSKLFLRAEAALVVE